MQLGAVATFVVVSSIVHMNVCVIQHNMWNILCVCVLRLFTYLFFSVINSVPWKFKKHAI